MNSNKKTFVSLILGICILLVLIFSATYAYFSVQSSNNFGSKTISAIADEVGNVALNGTSAQLKLNLLASDMMKNDNDITYWGTSDGTPSITQNIVTIGSTQVTGSGHFDCNYTLRVTATGTNNMYTVFQGMSGKSSEQIVLKIGDVKYDFNTSSLFPKAINGTLSGVSSSEVQNITAEFYMVNKNNVDQSTLAGTDISISINATAFSCVAVQPPTYEYYLNGYESNHQSAPLNNWLGYIRTSSLGTDACIVFNGNEICVPPNSWNDASSYKTIMESAGATCNNTYLSDGKLTCYLGNTSLLRFDINSNGSVLTRALQGGNSMCTVASNSSVRCTPCVL